MTNELKKFDAIIARISLMTVFPLFNKKRLTFYVLILVYFSPMIFLARLVLNQVHQFNHRYDEQVELTTLAIQFYGVNKSLWLAVQCDQSSIFCDLSTPLSKRMKIYEDLKYRAAELQKK